MKCICHRQLLQQCSQPKNHSFLQWFEYSDLHYFKMIVSLLDTSCISCTWEVQAEPANRILCFFFFPSIWNEIRWKICTCCYCECIALIKYLTWKKGTANTHKHTYVYCISTLSLLMELCMQSADRNCDRWLNFGLPNIYFTVCFCSVLNERRKIACAIY